MCLCNISSQTAFHPPFCRQIHHFSSHQIHTVHTFRQSNCSIHHESKYPLSNLMTTPLTRPDCRPPISSAHQHRGPRLPHSKPPKTAPEPSAEFKELGSQPRPTRPQHRCQRGESQALAQWLARGVVPCRTPQTPHPPINRMPGIQYTYN